ncbi:cysteine--tRNA ligase 2, cytoplasmic [Tanacetum coccineum]
MRGVLDSPSLSLTSHPQSYVFKQIHIVAHRISLAYNKRGLEYLSYCTPDYYRDRDHGERGPLELSAEEFLTDMADLQCLPPTVQPRVSDHMDQIKNMIAKVPAFARFLLNDRDKQDMLVQAAKDGEISWDSLWGKGRPGWHIECSAMSEAYLSEKFDIHGGGMDLIFPHHENEIAQNCAACPDSKIGYWMHNGFVTANNEKMSKSTGCWIMVTNLYHPLALRHFLLGTHYRSPVNYPIDQIEISSEAIFYIYQEKLRKQEKMKAKPQQLSESKPVSNDVGSLIELTKEVREFLNVLGLLSSLTYTEGLFLVAKFSVLLTIALGDMFKPLRWSSSTTLRAELTDEEILQRIEERAIARKNKDFLLADQIRTDLTSKGIALMMLLVRTLFALMD